MANQYEPPKTKLTESAADPALKKYSPAWKASKSPLRPLPIVLIIVLFFVFSAFGTTELILEGELWWVTYCAATLCIAYLFRGLWWGDERGRQLGVFCGFLFGVFNWPWPFDVEDGVWSMFDYISMGESIYFILAAIYLMNARGHRFFEEVE